MKMLTAGFHKDLYAQLPAVNVTVPSSGEGRTTDRKEIYAIIRLLSSLPHETFSYPLSVVKLERPDFEIRCNDFSIGVEHTEAIPRNAAHEAKLRADGAGPSVYMVSKTSIDEPRKHKKTLLAEIEANEPGEPWIGDEMEREWVSAIVHFVSKKMNVASREGFQRFSQNWLLIYDNIPAVGLMKDEGITFLMEAIEIAAPWSIFNRIFILDDSMLIEISQLTGVTQHAVNHCT
jgi:hypothetical protein